MSILLWVARITGTSILAFLLFFLIGHLIGGEEHGEGFRDAREVMAFICFPISTVVGLAIALKWEFLGGMITLAGMIGLLVMRFDPIDDYILYIPIVPAILYSYYGWSRKKRIAE